MSAGDTDFAAFVLGLASNAMLHLGAMPHPDTNKAELDLPLAQHNIQLLQMLREKTDGNLDPEEDALLGKLLYDLRLRYVETAKAARAAS